MATIREIAQETLYDMRDGIAWVAIWKKGRSWEAAYFWPDIDEHDTPIFDADDRDFLREIAETDPAAILVNSYRHNLGSLEDMTRDSLAGFIRWQYENSFYPLAECIAE